MDIRDQTEQSILKQVLNIYTKSGKNHSMSAADGYKYGVANAYCSVQENNAVSVSVATSHEAIYNGAYNSGNTSATY